MEDCGTSNGSDCGTALRAFCNSVENIWPWFYYSLIPAFGIIIFFSFLEQRVRLSPQFCHGRPGIAFPINLVDSYSDRWSNAFAFGSMSTSIVLLIFKKVYTSKDETTNVDDMLKGTVQLFNLIGYALLVSFVFYPILLCLRRKNLLGNVMGLAYSVVWTVFYAGFLRCDFVDLGLDSKDWSLVVSEVIVDGSGVTCFLVVTLRFFVGLILDLIRLKEKKTEIVVSVDGFYTTHFFKRVKFLFTPPLPEDTSGNMIVRLIRRYIFRNVPGFRFSRRNVCLLVLTVFTTLQVSVLYTAFGGAYLPLVAAIYTGSKDNQRIKDTFLATSVMSLIITASFLIDMQMRYRKHTVMLWRGDRSFCNEETFRYDKLTSASLRFSGFQIGYTLWGFVILQLLLWSLTLILVFCSECIASLFNQYWLVFVITILLYYGQVVMCRFVFLQKASDQRESEGVCCGRQTYLGLDNRRLFHVVVYVTMFLNVILGFLSCVYRILKAILLGTIFIGRMDHCILMKGWEFWDQGYTAYLGFLQLEVAHTHPVVITFCHFLLQSLRKPRELLQNSLHTDESALYIAESDYERNLSSFVSEDHTTKLASRLRRRWLVALTLKRNPWLALQRKRALCMKREESTRGDNISRDMMREGRYSAGETEA